MLPQFDSNKQQRDEELKEKKEVYKYAEKKPGAPIQVEKLPQDEEFGKIYQVIERFILATIGVLLFFRYIFPE